MNEIMTAISTIGFPAAMCIMLAFYIYKMQDKTNTIISENTVTLTKLVTLIEKIFDKIEDISEEE